MSMDTDATADLEGGLHPFLNGTLFMQCLNKTAYPSWKIGINIISYIGRQHTMNKMEERTPYEGKAHAFKKL